MNDILQRIRDTHDALMKAEPHSRAALQQAMQSLVELYGVMCATAVASSSRASMKLQNDKRN